MFGYVDEAVGFFGNFWSTKSHRLSEAAFFFFFFAAQNSDLIVREKARDPSEGWACPGCRCLHLGSSPGCGRARPCSPETRRDNFHISPRPPALL